VGPGDLPGRPQSFIIPSYTTRRHHDKPQVSDVRRNIEFGFAGTLLVRETAHAREYVRFVEIAADEAKVKMMLIHHAAFNTLEQNSPRPPRRGRGATWYCWLPAPFRAPQPARHLRLQPSVATARTSRRMLFPVPLWGCRNAPPRSMLSVASSNSSSTTCRTSCHQAEGAARPVAGFPTCGTGCGPESSSRANHRVTPYLATMCPCRSSPREHRIYSSIRRKTAPNHAVSHASGTHDEA